MRGLKHTLCVLSVLMTAAGPAQSDTGDEDTKPNPSMEREWKETVDALGSYTAEQRDKALKAGRKTLDAMDERLEKMQAWTQEHWNSMSEEAREQRSRTLEAMRRQRNEVAEWYGAMKHGSANAWDSTKQGFMKSYEKLQNTYRGAMEWFQSDEDESASQ